jgi:glycosyltransferase involved in cell wall biosynthesis
MNKRIAFLSTMDEYPWGGSEELWSMTATRLLRDGYRGAVWARRWPKPSERIRELHGLGCELHWREYKWPSLTRRVLRRLHIRPLPQEQPFRWLDSFQPDLIVVSLGYQGDVRTFGSEWERWKRPHVVIVQAVTEVVWPRDPELDAATRFLQAAEACYFVSESNRTLVETQFGCSLPNARIVRNPFNVRYDASPPWPGADDGFRLACVARLDPNAKGQDLVLQMLRSQKWKERNVPVSFFGSGNRGRSLARFAELHQLSNAQFMGFEPNVERIWSRHHALLLPSRYEGLPLAVVEAMLCGRVCIVTDVGGNAELLEDNESGFVAAAPTVPLLDEAMERAWNRRQEWRQMGQAAARQVRERVSPDPIGDFVTELKRLL